MLPRNKKLRKKRRKSVKQVIFEMELSPGYKDPRKYAPILVDDIEEFNQEILSNEEELKREIELSGTDNPNELDDDLLDIDFKMNNQY
jgi:hypothetical protein